MNVPPRPSVKKGGAAILFLGPNGSGFTVSVRCELTCSCRGASFLWHCCSSAKVDRREQEWQEDHGVASAVVRFLLRRCEQCLFTLELDPTDLCKESYPEVGWVGWSRVEWGGVE